MDDRRFLLIFEGRAITGHARREVIQKVAGHLGRNPQTVQKLFQDKPSVVKRDLDPKTAARLHRTFENMGVACRIEPQEEGSVSSGRGNMEAMGRHCPKCRADLGGLGTAVNDCPHCGIVISKFLKARRENQSAATAKPGAAKPGGSTLGPVPKRRRKQILTILGGLSILLGAVALFSYGPLPPSREPGKTPDDIVLTTVDAPTQNNRAAFARRGTVSGPLDRGKACRSREFVLSPGAAYDLLFYTRLDISKKPPDAYPEIEIEQFSNQEGAFADLSRSFIDIEPRWIDIAFYRFNAWAMDRSAHIRGNGPLSIEDSIGTKERSVFRVHWIDEDEGLITLGGPLERVEAVGQMPFEEIHAALADAPDVKISDASYRLKDLPIMAKPYKRYVAAVKFHVRVPAGPGTERPRLAHIRYAIGEYGGISLSYKSWKGKIILSGPDERIDCF